jgi:molecular chaperone HtpG
MSKEIKETFPFQSEVRQLLNILVYSLYKNKDVFLRELISNATDALNKVQFEILTNPDIEDKDLELKIDISLDKKQNKLIIEDTGIGMTRDELIANIGTIAHSGTLDYLKKIADEQEKSKIELIGKFGIGFYSSFMVAKEIHIYTRSPYKNGPAHVWKSEGESGYSIEETDRKGRGTRIELLLKKEDKEFLESRRIKDIILKHSKFVPFPIYVDGEKMDRMEAIWTQPKSKLKEKDYIDFFRYSENTQEEPETFLHLSSDAPVQFTALLYVPKTSLELLGFIKTEPGVDLYSKKILIQKGSKDLMPEYLRFVKGIIDSEEIPLNISRESIQNNVRIDKIRRHVVRKLIENLETIKDKEWDKYLRIWKNYNRNVKEGIIGDFDSRERLSRLLLFRSSKMADDKLTDLNGYVDRMNKEQTEIYYAAGTDSNSIRRNPALEAFLRKEYEVLFLLDPLDEFTIDHLHEYNKRKFTMVESADIRIDSEKREEVPGHRKKTEDFLAYLKAVYGDRIADVKISQRLVDSPCMLVYPSDGPSAQMEKILKMVNREYQISKRALEINPENELIRRMIEWHEKIPTSPALRNLALQLLDNMMLREGVSEDIEGTIARIQQIMLDAASGS